MLSHQIYEVNKVSFAEDGQCTSVGLCTYPVLIEAFSAEFLRVLECFVGVQWPCHLDFRGD